MKKIFLSVFLLLIIITILSNHFWPIASTTNNSQPVFKDFIASVYQEAIKNGISKDIAAKYLFSIKPPKENSEPVQIRLQKQEPEVTMPYTKYLQKLVPSEKMKKAEEEYAKNKALLFAIAAQYKVDPQIIIALWGLESDFGVEVGHFEIIETLAILAFHHHRSEYYRRQLLDALRMVAFNYHIPQQLMSAWDGGMGQPQFEPSIYFQYAVDYDNDGFANIWTSLPDVFASIANFLHMNGWHYNQPWGMEVKVPDNFPVGEASPYHKKPMKYWRSLGVRDLNGNLVANSDELAAVILPSGIKGPAFLVYVNFTALLNWNKSTSEALSAGIIASQLN